jgi:hypothetical protein
MTPIKATKMADRLASRSGFAWLALSENKFQAWAVKNSGAGRQGSLSW